MIENREDITQNKSFGLTNVEAETRLQKYGRNEIVEEKKSLLLQFISYFWGPIPWMIETAMILSAVIQHWADFFIILILLLANSVVGFWEEYQAGNAISALKAKLAVQARVKRDGKWIKIDATSCVPGDLLYLALGDVVPADAKITRLGPVEVDQSALTGESLPVSKSVEEVLFSGSIMRQGEAEAVIQKTGAHTYFGKTAQLVQQAGAISHFQRAVLKIGNYLIVLATCLVLFTLCVTLLRGDPVLKTIQFALVLTIAAIPVALPVVLSVTMAIGAKTLAAKEAVVTRLSSIEELAGVDVLCSDKTGTLTKNSLTLGKPVCISSFSAMDVIFVAALASHEDTGDVIDTLFINSVDDKSRLEEYEILHFQPFDPVHKRTEATVKDRHGVVCTVSKGAPQVILRLADISSDKRKEMENVIQEFADKGFRTIGVAQQEENKKWQLCGMVPIFDPPRDDAKATIQTAKEMGVSVKMVTGDQLAIAKETAKELGLSQNIVDGSDVLSAARDKTIDDAIDAADGFAQVFPEHKFHLVEMLQQRGHIVGMTGDGVNDAPSLKQADCGIAVSGATDAARSAASLVLLTPGLSIIIDAINESRKIFQRMNSYAIYRIAETLRVLLFMTMSILICNFYPLTAVMIVILALLNDTAILSIAYDHVVCTPTPESWNMRRVLGVATALGTVGVLTSFGFFLLSDRLFSIDRSQIQTLMYLKLSVAGHFMIFVTRTRGAFWSFKPANVLLGSVIGTQVVATIIAVFGVYMTPISWQWALFVWGYSMLEFLISDRLKLQIYRGLSV